MFKNPLVVGYKGEIGSFILNGLLKVMPKALNIWCFDINESEKEKIDRIKKSDYIFLCVPVQDTVKWLVKYKKLLKDKIIVEQASLKEWIYKDKRIKDLKIIPMHILFRPSATPNKSDRDVILIQNNVLEHSKFSSEFNSFRNIIEKITDSHMEVLYQYTERDTIKTHDMLMGFGQALIHKVIIALGKTISVSGLGQTFITKQIKLLYKRILAGDKDLYKFIQTNKYLPEIMKDFKKELNRRKIY